MTQLPAGTVTFLFTDMEGSTQLWENHPQEMRSALAQHNAITFHKGYVIKTTGDGAHAVFETAMDALHAAIQAQSDLYSAFHVHPSCLCLYEQVEYDRCVSQLRSLLAETELHTFWTQGSTMTMDQAIQLALN